MILTDNMKRPFLVALAAIAFSTCAYAQSDEAGPLDTPSGKLQFARVDRDFVATLDGGAFDRFNANGLTHFDDVGDTDDTVIRTLVQTDAGPVLYDLHAKPPVVLRSGMRMTVRRVFWQGDDIVIQGSQGWLRFNHGVLTKLQSKTTTLH